MSGLVVVLAGGTGGAKLARGMLDVVGPDELTVVANTGDDVEIYGAHVSPDPDLVTFWLADRIDERGWGLAATRSTSWTGCASSASTSGSTSATATSRWASNARALDGGARLTQRTPRSRTARRRARVLPMSDRPVRTRVLAHDRWWPLQEFMIKGRARVRSTASTSAASPPPAPTSNT